MALLQLIGLGADLPFAGDPRRVAVGWDRLSARIEQLGDAGLARFYAELKDEPNGGRLIGGILANSPFLSQCIEAEPEFWRNLLLRGPEVEFNKIIRDVSDRAAREQDRQLLMSRLRQARRRVALLAASCDITGYWSLGRVTECLSAFADTALSAVVDHLLSQAAGRGELRLSDSSMPQEDCGVVVLGMGKYGARELNYSSDIDLIILFDPSRIDYTGPGGVQTGMVRIARDLVTIMEQRTVDGYVYRVDLRLRPEPSSNPMAISVPAALSYYQRRGQDWERAAMIKARPVAGDFKLGREFLAALEPFVWRDRLDFWALRAIRSMKRQIDAHRGGGAISAAGHNIKLGRGGIREIEFLAQALELTYGGSDPYLRCAGTVEALTTLAESGLVRQDAAADLIAAYEFLRQLEHRLQMVDDRQTQTLPGDEHTLARIANFMQYEDPAMFEQHLLEHLRQVAHHYAGVFERTPGDDQPDQLRLVNDRLGGESTPVLESMGFVDQAQVFRIVGEWADANISAVNDKHSRKLLLEVAPKVLEACSRMPDPGAALRAFDGLLRSLDEDARNLLSTMAVDRSLLYLVVEIAGTTPSLRDRLTRDTQCLDVFAQEKPDYSFPTARILAAECLALLDDAVDGDRAVTELGLWHNRRAFEIGVATYRHAVDGQVSGHRLSDLHDGLLHGLWRLAQGAGFGQGNMGPENTDQGNTNQGNTEHGKLAVVALGRYGVRELTASSPVDVLIVAGCDSDNASGGESSAERMGACLRRVIGDGQVRFLDARVQLSTDRAIPSIRLEELEHRLADTHGTDLHLALAGARAVVTSADLEARAKEVLSPWLQRQPDLVRLQESVRRAWGAMSAGAAADPIRQAEGAFDRLELLTRYLRLLCAWEHPGLASAPSPQVLLRLGASDRRFAPAARRLAEQWSRFSALLCVTHAAIANDALPPPIPESLKVLMMQSTAVPSLDGLWRQISDGARVLEEIFNEITEGSS